MRNLLNHIKLLAFCMAAFGMAISIQADDPDKLPSSETVMKKSCDAMGGADKLKSVKSIRMKGKFAIPNMGLEGDLEVVQVMPNKVFTKAIIPGAGSQTVATNGKDAWEISTTMGPRLLQGKEVDQLREDASIERFYNPMKFYKEIKVVGMDEVDGEKSYKVKVTKKNGDVSTDYYSLKTGLQVKSEAKIATQMGDMNAKSLIKEYKEVNGLKFPSKIVVQLPIGERVLTYESIEINPTVEDKTFAVPEEIQNLINAGMEDDDGDDHDEDDG